MGGADVGKVSSGGFQVVVITGDACLFESFAMFEREETMRGAKSNVTFCCDGGV